ncbi:hypothetical protein D3C76_1627370 [compost metagenome]
MQQHGVVAGFGNGQMKTRVGRALFRPTDFIVAGVAVLQGIERRLEALTIRLCRPSRRVIGT